MKRILYFVLFLALAASSYAQNWNGLGDGTGTSNEIVCLTESPRAQSPLLAAWLASKNNNSYGIEESSWLAARFFNSRENSLQEGPFYRLADKSLTGSHNGTGLPGLRWGMDLTAK